MPRKKRPDYYRETVTAELRDLASVELRHIPNTTVGEQKHIMCPYTPLIPLPYAVLTQTLHGKYLDTVRVKAITKKKDMDLVAISNKYVGLPVTVFLNAGMHSKSDKDSKTGTLRILEESLRYDKCIPLISTINSSGSWNTRDILSLFDGSSGGRTGRFSMKSYSGATSIMSLFLGNGVGNSWLRTVSNYTPHILAVVLPENYLYVKTYIVAKGKIPLDKIIILIDRQLDETSFPIKGFRALYKKIEPLLKKTSCDIWKVPMEFIESQCFLQNFFVKEKNIIKRKQEIEGLSREFLDWLSSESSSIDISTIGTEIVQVSSTSTGYYNYSTTSFGSIEYEETAPDDGPHEEAEDEEPDDYAYVEEEEGDILSF